MKRKKDNKTTCRYDIEIELRLSTKAPFDCTRKRSPFTVSVDPASAK